MRPAIVALHGKGDNGPSFAQGTGLLLADATVAAPTGAGLAWAPAPYAHTTLEEDAARIDAIVGSLIRDHGADPERVYLVGFSNGGGLAVALSTLSDRFAGVATVAAAVRTSPETIATCIDPVDYLNIHGPWDDVVPYAGLAGSNFGALETTEAFRTRNAENARAVHIPVERAAHEWRPGTTEAILDFFGIELTGFPGQGQYYW
ncbi:PHB depolymerase family esterase [Corynebacterium bouchesdurhonense]|uniref:PHB depolymerase family esterase n=1 Tax=Corynebacterium bouchesdurhonense TaxID=1720192 RepID=UPI0008307EF9|nr:PHB depolymerase family esterase [Corynebacterium bouchesdurhonense]